MEGGSFRETYYENMTSQNETIQAMHITGGITINTIFTNNNIIGYTEQQTNWNNSVLNGYKLSNLTVGLSKYVDIEFHNGNISNSSFTTCEYNSAKYYNEHCVDYYAQNSKYAFGNYSNNTRIGLIDTNITEYGCDGSGIVIKDSSRIGTNYTDAVWQNIYVEKYSALASNITNITRKNSQFNKIVYNTCNLVNSIDDGNVYSNATIQYKRGTYGYKNSSHTNLTMSNLDVFAFYFENVNTANTIFRDFNRNNLKFKNLSLVGALINHCWLTVLQLLYSLDATVLFTITQTIVIAVETSLLFDVLCF